MQGRIGHRDAGHLHRLEACHRGHGAGAADLELDTQQLGQLLARGELVGDRPTRLARAEAQFALEGDAVDLEHHAVDLVGQRIASATDVVVVVAAGLGALDQAQLATDGDTPAAERLEDAHLGVRQRPADLAEAVGTELQRATGGDLRIQLAQAAGRRVARVGEGLAAGFHGLGVERLETGLGHEHLAAHFEDLRPAFAVQLQRYVANGAYVAGDVLAGAAIAAGGAAHQLAAFVEQADGQAVQLRLATVLDLRATTEQVAARQQVGQSFAYAAVEVQQVLLLEGVAEAEHGDLMAHFAERRGRRAADPLGRRVGRQQLRVLGLQRLQLAEQAIVFGVGNARFVEHVVTVIVGVQFGSQLRDAFGGSLGVGHGGSP